MKQIFHPEMMPETSEKNFTPGRKRFRDDIPPHTSALVLDEKGNICHITPAARHLLEHRPDQPIKANFFRLIHSSNLYQVMRDVADMVCYGKEKASWMVRLRTGRGAWQWFKVQARNLLDGPEAAILLHLREL